MMITLAAAPTALPPSTTSDSTARFLIEMLLLPVVVATVTYVLFDRLGEWRRRRNVSALGVVVVDSLLEELRAGVDVMRRVLEAVDDPTSSGPPNPMLPHESWSGMATLSDDVMLRVIAVSRHREFEGFQPRDLRSHCKNYFVHMRTNYEQDLNLALYAASHGNDWRTGLDGLLRDSPQPYLLAAQGVQATLETTRDLLDANSRRWFPR